MGSSCVRSAHGLSGSCQPLESTVGASCASIRCASSLYCEPNTQTCQAPSPEGGPCNPALNGFDCDDPRDRCDATGTCTARVGVGAACSPSETACVRWATCDGTTSTCVSLPAVGQACNTNAAGAACLGGGSCDPTTSTCTLAAVGDACL